MSHKFKGTGVAIVTPFNSRKEVDYSALGNLVKYITEGGVEIIVVLGTTGESVTLNEGEKKAILEKVLEVNDGKLPVVLGIGGNDTSGVIKQMKTANLEGVDGILSVSPYYNKPTQEGIFQHYKALNEETPKPIILYNVPPRTGSNVFSETVLRIAHDCKNVVAVKEASGDIYQSMVIIEGKPKDFQVLSGEDMLTLPLMACGADGVISVVANALPREFSDMVRQSASNDYNAARTNHYKVQEVIKYLFAEGNPGGIKAALKILGVTGDDMRLPLVNISDSTFNKLESLLKNI